MVLDLLEGIRRKVDFHFVFNLIVFDSVVANEVTEPRLTKLIK